MNKKIKMAREDYIKEYSIYDGNNPNINSDEISDDDLKLHTGMQSVKEIINLKDSNKAYLAEISSSLKTIKGWVTFWSILSIVAIVAYIIVIRVIATW
jgi:hypothetical protein